MTSTIERERAILQELARYYEARVEPTLSTPRACVLAARITNLMLTEFGISHLITHVDAFIVNDEWRDFINSGGHLRGIAMPETAWSIGYNSAEKPERKSLPGHLVVETDNYFVDLSSRQFDRPQHNIETDSPMVVPLGSLTELPNGVWSVPIRKGHYLFRDAAVPRTPGPSFTDWHQNCWHFAADCEATIRRALDE